LRNTRLPLSFRGEAEESVFVLHCITNKNGLSRRNDTGASLQDFSDVISHDNEAQMKPASGAYLRYVSERGEIATILACEITS
jgi:hypothetical protein